MKLKIFFIPFFIGVLVLAIHIAYFILSQTLFLPFAVPSEMYSYLFWNYFEEQEYFIGLSYALGAAFLAYSILTFLEKKRGANKGVLTGFSVLTIIYGGGCFLTGCCGSPMLVVYAGLFGTAFLGVTKPIMLAITIITVGIGFYWMNWQKGCGCSSPDCQG